MKTLKVKTLKEHSFGMAKKLGFLNSAHPDLLGGCWVSKEPRPDLQGEIVEVPGRKLE
jgi:hypothetical protein